MCFSTIRPTKFMEIKGGKMSFKQFFNLGLYKSSCILFSCLFFVSWNASGTINNKHIDIVSVDGSRNISSAAMASMNSSVFLVMQDCPILSSIQTRIEAGLNSQDIVEMMEEKDSQGRTLTTRLMTELASSAGCFASVAALKRDLCSNDTYEELCENLDQLEVLGTNAIKEEFEKFAGATVDSLGPEQLADKLDKFVQSRDDDSVVGSLLNKISNVVQDNPVIVSIVGLLVIALFGKTVLSMLGVAVLGAAAVTLKVAAVVAVVAVAGWFILRSM